MSVRSTFRDWIDRLLGYSEDQQQSAVPTNSSGTSINPQASSSRSPVSSHTSLAQKSSKSKVKSARSKTPERKKRKEKVPNVMRASVVDPELQIIPPLPRLSIREDTAEKLSRVLNKFNSMDMGGSDTDSTASKTLLTPAMKRKKD